MREPADIDLNLLVVFHEVFLERHVSVVARKLGLSQPTVSNALGRLRKLLADDLFVRTAAGMMPTPLAQQIAEPVAACLRNARLALNQQIRFDPASSTRRFTLAMTDVGEIHFMPRLVHLCTQAAPQATLGSVRIGAIDWQRALETGEVDLAIGAFTDVPESLFHRRLFTQPFVLMFARDHAFARKRKLTLQDYLKARHLIVDMQESPYHDVNERLRKAGLDTARACRVPHFTSVPYLLAASDMVVVVPEKLARSAAAHFDLAYTTPPLRLPSLKTSIFWHRRYNADSANQWLRNLAAHSFAE